MTSSPSSLAAEDISEALALTPTGSPDAEDWRSLITQRSEELLQYILAPTSSHRVQYHDENWVIINDKYPKSLVHLLMLPRDARWYNLEPITALNDPIFLASAHSILPTALHIAASQLEARFQFTPTTSTTHYAAAARRDAHPPPRRDWAAELEVGIHAWPSMDHLHIHVLSPDRAGECMRRKPHYLAFATPFFIRLAEFPLAEHDPRMDATEGRGLRGWKHWECVCWRCGRGFGECADEVAMKRFRTHLEIEAREWTCE